jgi:paraquat-inducible protein A
MGLDLSTEAGDLPTAAPETALLACHECDAIQVRPPLSAGDLLTCSRCGAHLRRSRVDALNRVLPLTLAASILFLLANMWPVVSIEVAGNRSSTSLLGAVGELYNHGVTGVAAIVVLTAFAAPAADLSLLMYALSALAVRRRLPGLPAAVRFLASLRPWAMVEIFLLGVLVSLAKLAGLAHVIPGIGLWSLCGLIVLTAAAHATFDVAGYWEKLEELA